LPTAPALRPAPNAIFRALADPTRRDILALLREHRRSVGDLAANFHVSRPAISKHVRVLRQAGLVVDRPAGGGRVCELNAAPLEGVDDWLEGYRSMWARNLKHLKAHVENNP
jgi:DNA-binding transcriptional ArsR family regulator